MINGIKKQLKKIAAAILRRLEKKVLKELKGLAEQVKREEEKNGR